MDIKEEDILGDKIHDHWYYVAKGRAMNRFLEGIDAPEVLDVGAGSEIFSRQLIDAGFCRSAVCVDPNYAEEHMESYHGGEIRFVKSIDTDSQRLVIMMDVLEHVSSDVGLLRQYTDRLESGSHVFITVPAFQFMWSGHDVFLEHFRRYTIESLENAVKGAGLTSIRSRYFFASLFLVVATIRLLKRMMFERGALLPQSDLRLYPDWLNTILVRIHDVERGLLFPFNRGFELSVFRLFRKD